MKNRAIRSAQRSIAVLWTIAFVGCTEKSTPASADAGIEVRELTSTAHRFRMPLWHQWKSMSVDGDSGGGTHVERIAAARRMGGKAVFEVAPRIEITSEPTIAADPESAYRAVKSDVERIGQQPGIEVVRSSLGFRPIGPEMVGDLSFRYRVGGAKGREVRQRSLLVFREMPSGPQVLSITATFLARDLERIEPEIQRMFAAVELFSPPDGGTIR
ncbi:MAG: hypothetical protein AAFN74_13010 [Myxococcota bacterium]